MNDTLIVLSFDESPLLTSLEDIETVGGVVSTVIVPPDVTAVTAVPAFPAVSLKAILKVTLPSVSEECIVYTAVHVFPDVFVYVGEFVIADPPDLNVTEGVEIVSFAVKVSIIFSPAFATPDSSPA